MSAARTLAAAADWRSWAVFRRNALVFLRNWKTAVVPPAMEPVVFFLAFGVGFSGLIESIPYRGVEINYATYVAAGLIAYTGFGTPYYEALYSAYVRMFYQKTWDGILAGVGPRSATARTRIWWAHWPWPSRRACRETTCRTPGSSSAGAAPAGAGTRRHPMRTSERVRIAGRRSK